MRLLLNSVRRCHVIGDRHMPHHVAAFGFVMLLCGDELVLACALPELPARMPELSGRSHRICVESPLAAMRAGMRSPPPQMESCAVVRMPRSNPDRSADLPPAGNDIDEIF